MNRARTQSDSRKETGSCIGVRCLLDHSTNKYRHRTDRGRSPARVSSSVADSVKFRFHPIFFPATQCLSVEKLNVVPVVIRSAVNESGLVDFLPHPSLICLDWQSTVRALSCVVHFYLPHAR